MKKVAIIDKCPSKNEYKQYFDFNYDLYHLCETKVKKLLKKDITLDINVDSYDLVILVGAEAAKHYASITSITNMAGVLVEEKFIALPNPSALVFKPEGQSAFLNCVRKIDNVYNGVYSIKKGDVKGIESTEEINNFLQDVLDNAYKEVAIDTETTGLYPRDGYVLGVSVTYKEDHGRYLSTDYFDDTTNKLLQQILDNFTIVFHNAKFDIPMMEYHLGVTIPRDTYHDTMLMHYVLDENNSHSLKALAIKYTNYGDYDQELEEYKRQYCKNNKMLLEDFTYDLIPFNIMEKYASIDTIVTFAIYHKFSALLSNNDKLAWVYKNLLLEGTNLLMDMQEEGIPFNDNRLKRANNYLNTKIEELSNKLYTFEEVKAFEHNNEKIFNFNSPVQMRDLLFKYCGLRPIESIKTDTGAYSTNAKVLELLANQHPIPSILTEIKKLTKIQNTYIVKLLGSLDLDGKVRTNFNLTTTTSGRLSSSGKFNAQQIVRDDPIVKGCIVAPPGHKVVSMDLKTGEMYYAAVLSGDKELQKVFKMGGDFHSNMAITVFGLTCDASEVKSVYPNLRQAVKAISFGILYGSGAKKVASEVTESIGKVYTVDEAQEAIDEYFTKFSKLKEFLDSRKKSIQENGYTYSPFGRKRRLPNVFSSDKHIASHEVRSGINSEIQSICSDVNLLGAIETNKEIKATNLPAKIIMLVHDSIVAIVKDKAVNSYTDILVKNVQKDRGYSINNCPIGVDIEVGEDYSFGKFKETYEITGHTLARI